MPCPVGWLCRNWLEHSKLKQNSQKVSIFQKLNLQPAAQNLSQVNNYLLHKSYQINKKNDWINISCTVDLLRMSQISGINLSDYLSASQNNFLSVSGNLGLSAWNIILGI